ncbi:hypothetical protein ESCO_006756 [Escovopsis weberi]|uniref:Mso1 N-terminal domain-containing protein n=1 Tax=Escovopsis weberi TaxID=150374 RepID=A0A0M8N5Y8_ESCWE|nr:hypothetical protein ESCO_006756 [Escovopsis weberi]
MTSWYSNLLTKTSSQISSLKSTLLSSEADGDTEDDTHVCRVLRDFYAEKGRPSPPWLPPDPRGGPNGPGQAAPQALYAQSQIGGQRFPGQHPQQQGPGAAGFGSLWDNSGNNHDHNNNNNNNNNGGHNNFHGAAGHVSNGGAGAGMGPGAPGGPGGPPAAGGLAGKRPPQLQVQTQSLRAGGARNGGMLSPIAPPAQRAGSYPNPGNQTPTFGGGTAQDRLRQRLWGGARTTSPSAQGGPFQPPPSPGAQHGGGGGGGGGDGGAYMGANAPWSTTGDDYFGSAAGGGGGGGGGASRRQGLANGPRR